MVKQSRLRRVFSTAMAAVLAFSLSVPTTLAFADPDVDASVAATETNVVDYGAARAMLVDSQNNPMLANWYKLFKVKFLDSGDAGFIAWADGLSDEVKNHIWELCGSVDLKGQSLTADTGARAVFDAMAQTLTDSPHVNTDIWLKNPSQASDLVNYIAENIAPAVSENHTIDLDGGEGYYMVLDTKNSYTNGNSGTAPIFAGISPKFCSDGSDYQLFSMKTIDETASISLSVFNDQTEAINVASEKTAAEATATSISVVDAAYMVANMLPPMNSYSFNEVTLTLIPNDKSSWYEVDTTIEPMLFSKYENAEGEVCVQEEQGITWNEDGTIDYTFPTWSTPIALNVVYAVHYSDWDSDNAYETFDVSDCGFVPSAGSFVSMTYTTNVLGDSERGRVDSNNVNVYTFAIDVEKKDMDSDAALPNVEFKFENGKGDIYAADDIFDREGPAFAAVYLTHPQSWNTTIEVYGGNDSELDDVAHPGFNYSVQPVTIDGYTLIFGTGEDVPTDYYGSKLVKYYRGFDVDENYPNPWVEDYGDNIIIANIRADFSPISTAYWFANMEELTEINGLELLDLSKCISVEQMFSGWNSKLNRLDLSKLGI